MEKLKLQYEKPNVEISCFDDQDILTTSQGAGDGWVQDPFTRD